MENRISDGINQSELNVIDAFLMVGQSNMAGRGDFGEVPEIKNPLCHMLRNGRWQPMSEPINPDRAVYGIRFHSGISLAASFADEYAKLYDRPVGLIPCAEGGSGIDEWMPAELLFDHAVMQTKLAMRTSNIKGILWHQGESDCKSQESLDAYKSKLKRVMYELRKQIGDIPVLIGEISNNISDSWKMKKRNIEFNRRLAEIVKEIPNSAIVSADGLELKADGVHFTSKSCREFGKRYFEIYKSMI